MPSWQGFARAKGCAPTASTRCLPHQILISALFGRRRVSQVIVRPFQFGNPRYAYTPNPRLAFASPLVMGAPICADVGLMCAVAARHNDALGEYVRQGCRLDGQARILFERNSCARDRMHVYREFGVGAEWHGYWEFGVGGLRCPVCSTRHAVFHDVQDLHSHCCSIAMHEARQPSANRSQRAKQHAVVAQLIEFLITVGVDRVLCRVRHCRRCRQVTQRPFAWRMSTRWVKLPVHWRNDTSRNLLYTGRGPMINYEDWDREELWYEHAYEWYIRTL